MKATWKVLQRYRSETETSDDEEQNELSSLMKKSPKTMTRRRNAYIAGRRSKEILFSIIVRLAIFLMASVAFYNSVTDWTLVESVFYVVNVGFGVGYRFPTTSAPGNELWTCVFVFISGSLVASIRSIMASFVINMSEERAALLRPGYQKPFWTLKRVVRYLFILWCGCGWLCFALIQKNQFKPISSLLFIAAATSGTGVEEPPNRNASTLLITIIFLMVGVPLNSVFWGSIADDLLLSSNRMINKIDRGEKATFDRRYAALDRRSEDSKVAICGCKLFLLSWLSIAWLSAVLILISSATLFYHLHFYKWDTSMAFFFTINVMMGVGYSRPEIPVMFLSKLYVAILCFFGAFSLVSGILLLNVGFWNCHRSSKTYISLLYKYLSVVAYVSCILSGFYIAQKYMAKNISSSLLFSLSTMTSAGMVVVNDAAKSEVATAVFMIVAVPTQTIFWSFWVSLYISSEEHLAYFRAHPFAANKMRLWLKRARMTIATREHEKARMMTPAEAIGES